MTRDAAVFFDKDGTLVPDIPYNCDPELMDLSEGAGEALKRLAEAGFLLFVVSNQSGVARGIFDERRLDAITARLHDLAAREGVRFAGVYYCPHHPEGRVSEYRIRCGCRKPRAGMLERAARAHGLDLERSWMIGDILDDVQAGRSAGTRTVLIDNGNETEWQLCRERLPHAVVRDLREAAQAIVALASSGRTVMA